MKNSPCYKCQRRSAICHAQCEDYHAWADALRAERASLRVGKEADAHAQKTIEINSKRAQTIRRVGQR